MANAKGGNMELAKKIEAGAALNKNELSTTLKSFKSQVEATLSPSLRPSAGKYCRQLMTLFSQNPKLQQCSAISLLSALMTVASLGLDLTPQLGQAYILPYSNTKNVNGQFVKSTEAQFQVGYRGAIALAYRSGQVKRIQADVVRENDYFKYSKGLKPTLEHRESDFDDRGEITHAYVVVDLMTGGFVFDVWSISKVIAHARQYSKGFFKDEYVKNKKTGNKIENANSPWVTDLESMVKKTLILSISKIVPMSTEAASAFAADGSIRTEATAFSDITSEKDVLTIPMSFDQYETQEDYEDTPAAEETEKPVGMEIEGILSSIKPPTEEF